MPPTNAQRAYVANNILDVFSDTQGSAHHNEPIADRISDLIINLLHLADREGVDIPTILNRALGHHTVESTQ